MANEEKMNKRDWYVELKTIVANSDYANIDEAMAFIDHQIDMIDAKAEKAAARAAAKREEGDALRQVVLDHLTSEPQSAEDLVAAIGDATVTVGKVRARLTQLCTANLATKEQGKTDDGRRVMFYSAVNVEE